MISLALALLASVVGLVGMAGGTRAIQRADYQRCLRSIARLEIETGIVEPPASTRYASEPLQGPPPNLPQPPPAPRRKFSTSERSPRERVILRRAHNGQGASPAELAYLSERAYKRWMERQS